MIHIRLETMLTRKVSFVVDKAIETSPNRNEAGKHQKIAGLAYWMAYGCRKLALWSLRDRRKILAPRNRLAQHHVEMFQ